MSDEIDVWEALEADEFAESVWMLPPDREGKFLNDRPEVKDLVIHLKKHHDEVLVATVEDRLNSWFKEFVDRQPFVHTPGVLALLAALRSVDEDVCENVAQTFAASNRMEVSKIRNYARSLLRGPWWMPKPLPESPPEQQSRRLGGTSASDAGRRSMSTDPGIFPAIESRLSALEQAVEKLSATQEYDRSWNPGIPITDPHVLNRDYSVRGGTWRAPSDDHAVLSGQIGSIELYTTGRVYTSGAVPPEWLLAAGCAALGVPTPEHMAKVQGELLGREELLALRMIRSQPPMFMYCVREPEEIDQDKVITDLSRHTKVPEAILEMLRYEGYWVFFLDAHTPSGPRITAKGEMALTRAGFTASPGYRKLFVAPRGS